MAITAVAQEEKDEHDDVQETGFFVTNPIPCSCYKYNNSSMLLFISTLLISCTATYLPQLCLATSTMASTVSQPAPPPPPAVFECGSTDIRNTCDGLKLLVNCTVITGSLDIVLLPLPNTTCNFNQFQFTKLREITGFLMFNDVRNLKNITNMFPNLTVIRGRQLFLNYAFIVSAMKDLERIEFRSLVAIQRGHILLKSNPKLCNTEGIYWDRLTLKPGENHILLENETQCPAKSICKGCPTDYCWSNQVCQKFESNSVLSLTQNIQDCHKQCLGGCYNHTAQGCVVCKSWTDHGTCVSECPRDKYAAKQYLRCYTREECVKKKNLYIYKNTCVVSCPGGYKLNPATAECDSCSGINSCSKVCNSIADDTPIVITHLMNAENLRGCQILNSTILITIHNRIDENELIENLKDVREIMGHLKIDRSPYLTSLNFFQNLEKVHGIPMENNQYSLIVYNNKNLNELWNVKTGFELMNGGIYIYSNNKLCNRNIKKFREKVQHDNSKDFLQTSDQDVLCAPAKLNLYLDVLSHCSIKLIWPKELTSNEVEIIYRPIAANEQLTEKSELDTEVCKRINWRRTLKFAHELMDNSTHYSYIVNNLEPHTKYAVLVKTFGQEDINHEARSEIKYVTTHMDIPRSPIIRIKSKTYSSLKIEFEYENREDQLVDYYILEVYEVADDKDVLDTRDYCQGNYIMYKDYAHEDYDDCCTRREKEIEDRLFLQQIKNEFHCSLDQKEYCEKKHQENNITHVREAILRKRLEHSETNYTLRTLERFHLYVIQVQACNHAGCGSHSMIFTRTNYSIAADKIYDLSACKVDHKNEYRVHFSEPKLPNGYITSYTLHFRYFIDSNQTNVANDLVCITRLEHERNSYLFIGHMNNTFNQAAVRVFSLGHQAFNDWINITSCSTTKVAGRSAHGWNIFLIFFLIGAAGTMVWICYKRKYWRKIPQLRRFLPLHMGWRYLRPEANTSDDRQILVDGFETVRFHNSAEDDMKHLVH